MTIQAIRCITGFGLAGLLCGGLSACSDDVTAEDSREVRGEHAVTAAPSWVESSVGGSVVELSIDPNPLLPGPLRLTIRVDHPSQDVLPITLDLVSPEMPMHGILRYESHPSSPGEYVALIDIPMEGLWELYVNLDYGADAAVFELNVAAGTGSEAHQHGSDPDSPDRAAGGDQTAHPHGSGT